MTYSIHDPQKPVVQRFQQYAQLAAIVIIIVCH